jgi:hypothetical protein
MVVGLGLGPMVKLGMVGISFWVLRLPIRLLRRIRLWKSRVQLWEWLWTVRLQLPIWLLRWVWLWKSWLQLRERLRIRFRQCRSIQLGNSIEGSRTTTATYSCRLLSRVNRWSPRVPDPASNPRLRGGPRLHKLIRFPQSLAWVGGRDGTPPWESQTILSRRGILVAGGVYGGSGPRLWKADRFGL